MLLIDADAQGSLTASLRFTEPDSLEVTLATITLRPLTEKGERGAKQKKVYDLDENGERIAVIDKKTGQQRADNPYWGGCQRFRAQGNTDREGQYQSGTL